MKDMNQSEIIGIEPFCDIWYKDCFHTALFPVMKFYIKTIKPFLLSETFFYQYETIAGLPKLSYNSMRIMKEKSVYDILAKFGICLKAKIKSNDVVGDLINCINEGHPVITGIDCFYESIRLDAYNKQHIAHALLFYGYNKEEANLSIIEHDFRTSTTFKPRKVGFTDVINSYNGFLNKVDDESFTKNRLPEFNRMNGLFPSFYEFSLLDSLPDTNHIHEEQLKNYIQFVFDNQPNYNASQSAIANFKNDLMNLIDSEQFLSLNHELFFESINDVINNKKLEKYVFQTIFPDQLSVLEFFDKETTSWTTIRTFLAKYAFSKKYNETHIRACREELDNILNAEIKYHESLFEFLKEVK